MMWLLITLLQKVYHNLGREQLTAISGNIYELSDLHINCVGTGSKGNNIRVTDESAKFDIVFDIGLPFSKIKPHMRRVKHVFITHIHGDHITPTTMNQVLKYNPFIKVYMLRETYDEYLLKKGAKEIPESNLCIVQHGSTFEIGEYECIVRLGKHSVPVMGLIFRKPGLVAMYLSDSMDFTYFEEYKGAIMEYDVMIKELNHREDLLTTRIYNYEEKIKNAALGKNMAKERSQLSRLYGSLVHANDTTSKAFGWNCAKSDVKILNIHGSSELL